MVKGNVHSIETMGGLDGPGLRVVVFMQGCNLRCKYCHNPDTWEKYIGKDMEPEELIKKIMRYKPYFKNGGGVTFSGGEPLLQAEFLKEVITELKKEGIHTAIDTSGILLSPIHKEVSLLADLIILDIKLGSDTVLEDYGGYSLAKVIVYLKFLEKHNKEVYINCVVIPTINDDEESIKRLKNIVDRYNCIKKVTLLPFRKICVHKYEAMGIDFPFSKIEQLSDERIEELTRLL